MDRFYMNRIREWILAKNIAKISDFEMELDENHIFLRLQAQPQRTKKRTKRRTSQVHPVHTATFSTTPQVYIIYTSISL